MSKQHRVYIVFLLRFYGFETQDKPHSKQTRDIGTILFYCWPSFADAGPAIKQHRVNVSYCLSSRTVILRLKYRSHCHTCRHRIDTISCRKPIIWDGIAFSKERVLGGWCPLNIHRFPRFQTSSFTPWWTVTSLYSCKPIRRSLCF